MSRAFFWSIAACFQHNLVSLALQEAFWRLLVMRVLGYTLRWSGILLHQSFQKLVCPNHILAHAMSKTIYSNLLHF